MPYVLHQQTATPATADPSASDVGAQIRASVEQQLKAAGVSAKQARTEAARAAKSAGSYNIKTDAKGNVSVSVGDPGDADAQAPVAPTAPVITTGTAIPPDSPLDIPPRLQDLGFALFLMIAVIAIGKPIARALGGVIERRAIKPAMPPEFGARLERIEQGIESVSIEIERISESQRYLLKVQSPAPEKAGLAQPRSAS